MNIYYCHVSISPIRKEAKDQSEMVSQLLFGELIEVLEQQKQWLKIRTLRDGYEGFIDEKHVEKLTEKEARRWQEGLFVLSDRERTIKSSKGIQRICRGSFVNRVKGEFLIGNDQYHFIDSPSKEMDIFEIAEDYLNTPYLWGGKSPFGIDCSGFTQVIYGIKEINLPRDAYQQAEMGTLISYDEIEGGELAFFKNNEDKIIHVGLVTPNKKIYHASGYVRLDELTEKGIFHIEKQRITHILHSICKL